MTQPELFDVVELLIDLPESNLRAGVQVATIFYYFLQTIEYMLFSNLNENSTML